MGCIFKKKWKDKKTGKIIEGETLWIKYYQNGRPYQESTHSKSEARAKKLLNRRVGEIAKGEPPGIVFDKIRFEEIAEAYLTDYRINQRKSLGKAEHYVKYLKKSFGGCRVTEITTDAVKKHIERKIEEGKSNATINRDLSALKRMFHLAKQSRKVSEIPYIPMLKESNVRKGFFEYDDFLTLKEAMPDYLKPILVFAYHTGWRKGEILGLTWDKIDIKQGIIRLDPGETKNEEARTLYMNRDLWREMRLVHAKRRLGCAFVFHHNGQPIRKFEKMWNAVCRETKMKGKLFHDFRRTAARNMVRSGIQERVAMTMTGHKTRSIFDRYNIVSDQDLKEAAMKQQAFIDSQNLKTVSVPVSVAPVSSITP